MKRRMLTEVTMVPAYGWLHRAGLDPAGMSMHELHAAAAAAAAAGVGHQNSIACAVAVVAADVRHE